MGPQVSMGWLGSLSAALAALVTAVLLPLSTFLVAAWLLGWQLQAVESGSMSPTYPVGSLLVVGQIDAADVSEGMAIVFEDPTAAGRLVTHRVVERVANGNLMFWTQGDANATRDSVPVPARMVRGRVLWQVPGLGSVTALLRWPLNVLLLVVLPGLLLVLGELRTRRGHRTGTAAGPVQDLGVPVTSPVVGRASAESVGEGPS